MPTPPTRYPEEEVAHTDRRIDQEVTTTAVRSWWETTAAHVCRKLNQIVSTVPTAARPATAEPGVLRVSNQVRMETSSPMMKAMRARGAARR